MSFAIMKFFRNVVVLFLLTINGSFIYAQSNTLLIGPTLHYYIGNTRYNISGSANKLVWGIEVSYWNLDHYSGKYPNSPAMGVDLGIEFDGKNKIIYSEFQSGLLLGASTGLVCQFGKNFKYETAGFQWSIWGAAFGGMELRFRILDDIKSFSPGGILKVPLYFKSQPNNNLNFNMHF